MCLNPLFLRIIYLTKVFLNILRFLVPLMLIFKLVIDIYKRVLNPKDDEGLKMIKNRIIAAVIVFLVPTLVGLIITFISKVADGNVNNGLSQCLEFANLENIKTLEEEISEEELAKYINKRNLNLSKYEDRVEAYRALIASRQVSAGVGEHANNDNPIKCGSGSQYNTGLSNAVRSAGYKTREGVVAAALYLSSHIDVHIPYFWSGGHFHTYSGYADKGDNFIGVPDKWGCSVTMIGKGTPSQTPGKQYPFGMDCSGFVAWAIFNGGYYTGSNELYVPTDGSVFGSLGGISLPNVKVANAKGKIKPGDIATKSGHVGMVVEVSDNKFKVAEERGTAYGLVITEHEYKTKSKGFQYIVQMDKFYSGYKSSSSLWSGFH